MSDYHIRCSLILEEKVTSLRLLGGVSRISVNLLNHALQTLAIVGNVFLEKIFSDFGQISRNVF